MQVIDTAMEERRRELRSDQFELLGTLCALATYRLEAWVQIAAREAGWACDVPWREHQREGMVEEFQRRELLLAWRGAIYAEHQVREAK